MSGSNASEKVAVNAREEQQSSQNTGGMVGAQVNCVKDTAIVYCDSVHGQATI